MAKGRRAPPTPEREPRCRCGAKHAFGTDGDGHVIETCTACGQMTTVERTKKLRATTTQMARHPLGMLTSTG